MRAAQGEIAAYTFYRGFRFIVLEGEADVSLERADPRRVGGQGLVSGFDGAPRR